MKKHATGNLLGLIRSAMGLSQDSFADKLHMSKSIISRYESGDRRLTKEKFEFICHKLGLSKKLTALLIADTVSMKNKDIARELGLMLLTRLSSISDTSENYPSEQI